MRKYFTYIIILLFSLTLYSETYNDKILDFEVVKVRDGDTFVINIKNIPDVFGKEISVRIRGIDTPEKTDKRGDIRKLSYQAKEELETLLRNACHLKLYNLGRDKYFRLLASVEVDGKDIAGILISKGLAKRYNGGKKEW